MLNTIGVALAADSAVTIGSSKVFNTADKLFSLSKHHPIGIMIYGNASFMGVPWETVIKIYRKKLDKNTFNTLQEYSDSFFGFLKNDLRFYDLGYENNIVRKKFHIFLTELLNYINSTVPEIWRFNPNESQIKQMIYGEASYYADAFLKYENSYGFNDSFFDSLGTDYGHLIVDVVEELINIELDDEILALFMMIAGCLVMKDIYNDETGIVIAGFGEEEIFPSLKSYLVEGIFKGALKYKEEHDVKISATRSATIVPFAQQEMVHSFLTGIDPDLKNEVIGLIETITNIYPDVVNQHITKLNYKQMDSLRSFGSDLLRKFEEEVNRMVSEKFSNPVIETVASFPKEELAAMAEALVNLTSIKRKMSFQTETVGGPIDVAVISKGDGFIWIKRKHYFKPELNHPYFKNYMER